MINQDTDSDPKAAGDPSDTETGEDAAITEAELEWQRQMLPMMRRMVVGLTLFFLVASAVQLAYLHSQIDDVDSADLSQGLVFLGFPEGKPLPGTGEAQTGTASSTVDPNRHGSAMIGLLAILEANAVERRYHQANVSLMSRVWVRYLAFVTGVVMAMVGAVFVLGKIRGPKSSFKGGFKQVTASLQSSSPGLFLAFMGTVLIMTAIIVHHPIEVKDEPLYTAGWGMQTRENNTSAETNSNDREVPASLNQESAPVPEFLTEDNCSETDSQQGGNATGANTEECQ